MYFSANPKKGVFSNLHLFNLICSCGRSTSFSAIRESAAVTKQLYKCTLNYEEEKNTFKLDVKIYVLYTVKCIG